MSLRHLLLVALTWHVIGTVCFAQASDPSPSPSGFTQVVDWVSEHDKEAIPITIIGLGIFYIQRAVRGHGKYHVNQFRVYFKGRVPPLEPVQLAETLKSNFITAFENERNSVAKAEKHEAKAEKLPSLPDAICFRAKLLRVTIANFFLKPFRREIVDCVLFVPNNPGIAGFAVQTLGVRGLESASDEADKTKQSSSERDANAFTRHFLAGTRSWRIFEMTDCDAYGEPVPFDGEQIYHDGTTFFLETAALERYSAWYYALSFSIRLANRKDVENCWSDFLCAALNLLGVPVDPISCTTSQNEKTYMLGKHVWYSKSEKHGDATGDGIQIWLRESIYTKKQIKYLDKENYRQRLFQLHPLVQQEYRLIPPQTESSQGSPT